MVLGAHSTALQPIEMFPNRKNLLLAAGNAPVELPGAPVNLQLVSVGSALQDEPLIPEEILIRAQLHPIRRNLLLKVEAARC